MGRVAVFVDAGYLFAQGSTALAGQKIRREQIELNVPAVVTELTTVADAQSAGAALLRIYWYDGVSAHRGPTAEQVRIASTNNVKLRLGFLNSQGQQKGVDSLIVTDFVDLARNQCISDAVLLSGDEDVRIGVQIAQSFGVRVHLLGITPSRGSQSPQLIQEADTVSEWDKGVVGRFLAIRPGVLPAPTPVAAQAEASKSVSEPVSTVVNEANDVLRNVAFGVADALSATEIASFHLFQKTERGVPSEFDRLLLTQGRVAVSAELVTDQKRSLRRAFVERILAREAANLPGADGTASP